MVRNHVRWTNAGSRTKIAAAIAGLAAVALLAGCAQASSPSSSEEPDGPVTLRFAWWGNDIRNAQTQEIIDLYEELNPNVTIVPEAASFTGYFDKLATQTAGGNAPDIIQMSPNYLSDYAGRGVLLDLGAQESIDLADTPQQAVDAGKFQGTLYALATGRSGYVVMANTEMFEAAGIPLPDDETWTWDDYIDVASELAAATGGYGAGYGGAQDAVLSMWLEQNGEHLFSTEGDLDFEPETAAGHWQRMLDQLEANAGPTASAFNEDTSAPLEQTLFASGQTGLDWYSANQYSALSSTMGKEIVLLRPPSLAGEASENGVTYSPPMLWSASARTDHPEAAADFINFLHNNVDAGKILLTERGVPDVPAVLEAITPILPAADQVVVDYMTSTADDLAATPPGFPKGSSTITTIIIRYTSEVLSGALTPDEAGQRFHDELQGLIDAAN